MPHNDGAVEEPYDASQFGMTALWRDMQSSFRQLIAAELRKTGTRRPEFTGSAAVDVLFHFMKKHQHRFGKKVTKEKAIKVLNMWLGEHFLLVATNAPVDHFEDSKRAMYTLHNDENENDVLMVPAERVVAVSLSPSPAPFSAVSSPQSSITDGRRSPATLQRIRTQVMQHSPKMIRKKLGYSEMDAQSTDSLASSTTALENISKEELLAADDSILHELALFHLLTQVEVSVLDRVIEFREKAHFQGETNRHLFDFLSEFLNKVGLGPNTALDTADSMNVDEFEDNPVTRPLRRYFEAALVCVPDCKLFSSVCADPSASLDRERELLAVAVYKEVVGRYEQLTKNGKHSLFPTDYASTLNALCDQLLKVQGKERKLTLALQYLVFLLPAHGRDALQRVLAFLTAIKGTDLYFKLPSSDALTLNAVVALDRLVPFIIPSIVAEGSDLLRSLIDHLDEGRLFEMPDALKADVAKQLWQRKGAVVSPEPSIRFCVNQRPAEEVQKTAADVMEEHLVTLMNQIIDNTRMPLAEKKKHIDAFAKQYPSIHVAHFSNLGW